MKIETWQGFEVDPAFTKFRKKLEDLVTQKINNGRTIGHDAHLWATRKDYSCPLGCASDYIMAPLGSTASDLFDIETARAWNFIVGFGTGGGNNSCPYYRLGQLYRARFP